MQTNKQQMKGLVLGVVSLCSCLWLIGQSQAVEGMQVGTTHIGTFEGSTTFTTSSENGIHPGLFIEVMDDEGNLTQYESEEGIITIPNTKEGAYVTQAKLLGKTKYRDQDTNELLDEWEDGRNLRLESVENPELKVTGKNLFDKTTTKDGYEFAEDQVRVSSEWFVSDYIKVDQLTTYKLTKTSRIHIFDKDKNLIDYPKPTGGLFTTPLNAAYVKFNGKIEDKDIWQLERGEETTTYEPYQSSVLSSDTILMISESMIEQGSFYDSYPFNTVSYETIKVRSGDFYEDRLRTKGTYPVEKGALYTVTVNPGYEVFIGFCKDGLYAAKHGQWLSGSDSTFKVPDGCDELFFALRTSDEAPLQPIDYSKIGLEMSRVVELQGIGKVRDTLDLVTGELTQRIEEIELKGDSNEKWSLHQLSYYTTITRFEFSLKSNNRPLGAIRKELKCNQFVYMDSDVEVEHIKIDGGNAHSLFIYLKNSKLVSQDVEGLKKWLTQHPITVQYQLVTPTSKTVRLSATHQFRLLDKSFIQISGMIPPVITSITVPTDELSFALDSNQEAGQQFIAPEFEVTNESNAPLTLTLKTFEQTTDILNDVLPSKYDSWEGLNKQQSKDIALGLVANSSTDWLDRVDEPYYVSETNNKELGTIKPKGTVGFNFIAHHGQAFSEMLNPSYRLTFVFDLLN